MKKIIFILFSVSLLLSCGSSGVVKEARKTINGNWTLRNVTYPNAINEVKVSLLDDSSADCFIGSQWNFISNNNTGSYAMEEARCNENTRFFIWSVEEEGDDKYDLLLKPTDSDYKSPTENRGFRMNILNLDQNEMVWEQTVSFEGNPFTIRMNFYKN